MSILIWVQTVCNRYKQTVKVVASEERVKPIEEVEAVKINDNRQIDPALKMISHLD